MNDSDPDHRIAFNECSEFILAEVACTCRTLRQNQVTQISSAVVYTDFYFVRNICAEFPQHGPRFTHGTRAVFPALVPVRREPEQRARITRAEGADNQIVDLGRVLHHQQQQRADVDTKCFDGGGCILQERLLWGSTQARATT